MYYIFNLDNLHLSHSLLFFFNDPSTTEIYTLSLHDALPISQSAQAQTLMAQEFPHPQSNTSAIILLQGTNVTDDATKRFTLDRKSTRLNSSHPSISYAVFCLKKKKIIS